MTKELSAKQEVKIQKQDEGYLAVGEEKRLFFPNAELINIGCKNCVWRLHGQCPYGYPLEEGQMNPDGICNELIQFVFSLAELEDSVTGVWEKFLIYKTRLQESEDYRDFLEKQKEVEQMEKDSLSYSKEEYEKLDRVKMEKTAAKMWWAKLNQNAIISCQKIRDREVKQSEIIKLPGIFSAKTINFNITKKDA